MSIIVVSPPRLTHCLRYAPTIDLVLLSHGDLAHVGLYPYAHARWGLKAPAYATLPVQAMGRIAVTEDVEGIRDEEDVGDIMEVKKDESEGAQMEHDGGGLEAGQGSSHRGKYVATVTEVYDAFAYLSTLRYSQPIHLQGTCASPP